MVDSPLDNIQLVVHHNSEVLFDSAAAQSGRFQPALMSGVNSAVELYASYYVS